MTDVKKILIVVALALLAGAVTVAGAEKTLRQVQTLKGEVRSAPSFLSPIVARLAYGDRVEVVGRKGAWQQVRLPGAGGGGWLHGSVLTKKTLALSAGDRNAQQAATSDELALAGKGFNRQVEGAFRDNHPEIDFAWIDRMESMVVTPEEMRRFLEQGGLSAGKGAL